MRYKKTIIIFTFLTICYMFRGSIYRTLTYYEFQEERTNEYDCKDVWDCRMSLPDSLSLGDKVLKVQEYVSRGMDFSISNESTDPMDVFRSGHGNCIGFSRINAAILDCFSKKTLTTKIIISKIYFIGFDLHQVFSNPFFKDHDVVVVKSLESGEIIVIDPSLYEYTGIKYVQKKEII